MLHYTHTFMLCVCVADTVWLQSKSQMMRLFLEMRANAIKYVSSESFRRYLSNISNCETPSSQDTEVCNAKVKRSQYDFTHF